MPKYFKHKVTWLSAWIKPEVFLVNTQEDVDHLIFHGKEQQFTVEVEDGQFQL